METTSRRQVLKATAACAGALCPMASCGPSGSTAPSAGAGPAMAAAPLDVGPLAAFDRDGIYDQWMHTDGFFIVRADGRLYAPAAVCTHRAVRLVYRGGDVFRCPRHGSTFTSEGEVTKGPATRALPRLAIRLNERGRVIVDPSARFAESQWSDPRSLVIVNASL